MLGTRRRIAHVLAALVFYCGPLPVATAHALDHTQLVIVESARPLSVRIGGYYGARRAISFQNLIKVRFPMHCATLIQEVLPPSRRKSMLRRCPRCNVRAHLGGALSGRMHVHDC